MEKIMFFMQHKLILLILCLILIIEEKECKLMSQAAQCL